MWILSFRAILGQLTGLPLGLAIRTDFQISMEELWTCRMPYLKGTHRSIRGMMGIWPSSGHLFSNGSKKTRYLFSIFNVFLSF